MSVEVKSEIQINTIEEAIADIRQGKLVIVVDDEDRENEGDFIGAAEMVNPEMINFMATHGRGLICTPLCQDKATKLDLNPMVSSNTDLHRTAFTVSIDYRKKGCTTGISAYDRATGIKAICEGETVADDFARPGHIFPLVAVEGGVLRRSGHTEAAVDLAKLAGFQPVGVLVEILNADGTMARLPQLKILAKALDLKLITIKDLVSYRMRTESLISRSKEVLVDTEYGKFNLISYIEQDSELVHLAIVKGEWEDNDAILTRVHASTNTSDLIASIMKDHGKMFSQTLKKLEEEQKGVFLLIRQEDHKDELLLTIEKLLKHQERGEFENPHPKNSKSTIQRNIGIGAQILKDLNIRNMKLLTSNVERRYALNAYDLNIVDYVKI